MTTPHSPGPDSTNSAKANRHWWDLDADNYHEEHSNYLTSFYWSPEMLHEKDINLLGDNPGTTLELGCGSAPCSTWLAKHHPEATVIGFDISSAMLRKAPQFSAEVDASSDDLVDARPLLLQADAHAMPFAPESFDTVFSVFGAIPFVADTAELMREVYGLLKPGGRFVFSVTHPMRWIFPDDPTERGLTVYTSYFDRTPYSEQDPFTGEYTYVEHHRTLSDRIRELIGAGFILDDFIEPEWPADLNETWGQWSRLRGELFPGTAIFVAHKPE
ncbi:MAG: class I SAM-dependent methyltransferase [Corynebacterium sp.]|nr:class I SAM-dependent methyltransferase [Corynebacterium sp.]